MIEMLYIACKLKFMLIYFIIIEIYRYLIFYIVVSICARQPYIQVIFDLEICKYIILI